MPHLRKTSLTIYVPTLPWLLHESIKAVLLLIIFAISSIMFPIVRDDRETWVEILMIAGWMISVNLFACLRKKAILPP